MNSLYDAGAADGGYRTLQASPVLEKILESPELGNEMGDEELQFALERELLALWEQSRKIAGEHPAPCFSLSLKIKDAGMIIPVGHALRWVHNLTINGVLMRRFELVDAHAE